MNRSVKVLLKSCLVILLSISFVIPSMAMTDDELENKVRTISDQLRCPTCQGLSVKDSEAGLSINMKNKIREMLQEGQSENQIINFFVQRYGEWILRSPKKEGFNLILWLLPLVLIVVAGGIVIFYLLKKSRPTAKESAKPLSDAEKKLLEKDLDRFKSE